MAAIAAAYGLRDCCYPSFVTSIRLPRLPERAPPPLFAPHPPNPHPHTAPTDCRAEYGGYITGQIRRLGASCDWSRERFTLEPELCDAVTEAFCTLHERGLIYKGEYMVNWSPSLGTAVSSKPRCRTARQ